MKRYDAIVVGSGAMGSSIAHQLAARGVRTLVLEKFTLNHPYGSSHGRTRIIRTAYAEHPSYVPMVRRAFELWRELETRSGRRLLVMTGGLMIGRPGTWLVKGTLRSAKEHRLPHSGYIDTHGEDPAGLRQPRQFRRVAPLARSRDI